jgi:hypothetical protein
MTIAIETTKQQANGDGATTVFGFPSGWDVKNKAHVRVIKDTGTVRTILVVDVDYTVSLTSSTITMTVAPAIGTTITIRLYPPLKQEGDLRNRAEIDLGSHEDLHDARQRQLIRHEDDISRAIRLPESEVGSLAKTELARAVDRALKFFSFDASGNPTVANGVTGVPDSAVALTVDTIAALKALALPASALVYLVRGYSAVGDGGGGLFVWSAASAVADNGGTILQRAAGGAGRWIRIYSGSLNVKWFGATGDGVTDDHASITSAIAAAVALGGGVVEFPAGNFKTTATLVLSPEVTLRGAGKFATTIKYSGTGRGIETVSPINSSTGVYTAIEDIGVEATNASNVNGAIVDVGGTYIRYNNVAIFGTWLYGIVLDQSELVDIDQCHFTTKAWGGAGAKPRAIWMLNGADYTVGANPGFTNRIAVTRCQFNSAAIVNNFCVVDDGGGDHVFRDNNFNAHGCGIRFAGTLVAIVEGNLFEGQQNSSIELATNTLDASTFHGPNQGVKISTNGFAPDAGCAAAVRVVFVYGGEIVNNLFSNTDAIYLLTNPHISCDMRIAGNQMNTFSAFGAFSVIVADSLLNAVKRHRIEQTATTRVTAGISAGTRTVTPSSMFGISVGKTLFCCDANGGNTEFVTVIAETSTTFDAVFASAKSANWTIQGTEGKREDSGSWTPTIRGDGGVAGAHTYSMRKGFWCRIGKKVHVTGNISVSTVDATWTGNIEITGLPWTANVVDGTTFLGNVPLFGGFTLAGARTQLGGIITGTSFALRKSGTAAALAVVPVGDVPGATLDIYFEATYYADP